jgi:hypothetical protein
LGTVISEDTFASGDMFISLSGTAATDVIETYNCIYEYQVVRRAGGRDVTHNYDINIENTGTFVIYKRDITLRPNDVDIVYDGKYHAPTYVNTDKSSLISGHTVTAEMFGSRKNVGTTVTAWILSLGGISSDNLFVQLLKPTSFTPVLALIGIILLMFKKGKKRLYKTK